MPNPLIHLTSRDAWEAAQADGVYRAASLDVEGFIHLSTPEQAPETIRRHFRGRRDLVALTIAPERLTAPLRWEDTSGHGVFPHLYGPLNLDAVIDVVETVLEDD